MTETTAATDRGHADAIAAIFEDLLGIAPVGTDEDFFALGGHSLLAVQLMARINETFETDVPLAALFDVDGADGDGTPTRVARLVSGGFGGLDQPDLVRQPPIAS